MGSVLGALAIHLGLFLGLTTQNRIGPLAGGTSQVVTVELIRSREVEGADASQATLLAAPHAFTPGHASMAARRDASTSPMSLSPLTSPTLTAADADESKGQAGPSSAAAASVPDMALRDDYQRRLVAHIEAFKRYPPGSPSAHGAVQLVFEIDRRGGVLGVWVVKSSGVGILDVAAVDTVRRAQPVPPIPQELPGLLTMPLSVVFGEQG